MNNPIVGRQRKPAVLIVEDDPDMLKLLDTEIRKMGYSSRPVKRGLEALNVALRERIDLVLLDLRLPDIDGYEVCRKLKRTRFGQGPIIFLTGRGDTESKIKAFEAGCVDYVTKSGEAAEFEELKARLGTHLALHRQKQELEEQNNQLEELQKVRQILTQLVAYDLRKAISPVVKSIDHAKTEAQKSTSSITVGFLTMAERSLAVVTEMIETLFDVNRAETGGIVPDKKRADLVRTTRDAVDIIRILAGKRSLTLDTPDHLEADYDAAILRRVLFNLLDNSIKYVPEEGQLLIRVGRYDKVARVELIDDGPGEPVAFQDRIFEEGFQAESQLKKLGTGLGLYFCRLAIEAHGGQIGIIRPSPVKLAKERPGSTFWFTIPIEGRQH